MTGYRTLAGCLALAGCVLVALWMCRAIPGETADKLFATAAWALTGIAGLIAGKGAVGVLAQGTGVKGAVRALLTDAKPGEPDTKAEEPTK